MPDTVPISLPERDAITAAYRRRELFAQVCERGPAFTHHLRRFADACGFDEYGELLEILVDEVFLPWDDELLADRSWPAVPVAAAGPPVRGMPATSGYLFGDVVGVGHAPVEATYAGTWSFYEPWTGEPAPAPSELLPTGIDVWRRSRGTTGPFGFERKQHPDIGPITAMTLDPPGLPAAVIPLSDEAEGYVPFDGVCARSFLDVSGVAEKENHFFDDPYHAVEPGQAVGIWRGGEPVWSAVPSEDGLWLFTGQSSGVVTWSLLPLTLDDKWLAAPTREEQGTRRGLEVQVERPARP